jgi:hypothetical protein
MTLDELRRQRAQNTLALIDRQHAVRVTELPGVALRRTSARELEWLGPRTALVATPPVRSQTAPSSSVGVASPFMPSILVVTYNARYYLAVPRTGLPPDTREAYVVYGALQATVLPTSRGIDDP